MHTDDATAGDGGGPGAVALRTATAFAQGRYPYRTFAHRALSRKRVAQTELIERTADAALCLGAAASPTVAASGFRRQDYLPRCWRTASALSPTFATA